MSSYPESTHSSESSSTESSGDITLTMEQLMAYNAPSRDTPGLLDANDLFRRYRSLPSVARGFTEMGKEQDLPPAPGCSRPYRQSISKTGRWRSPPSAVSNREIWALHQEAQTLSCISSLPDGVLAPYLNELTASLGEHSNMCLATKAFYAVLDEIVNQRFQQATPVVFDQTDINTFIHEYRCVMKIPDFNDGQGLGLADSTENILAPRPNTYVGDPRRTPLARRIKAGAAGVEATAAEQEQRREAKNVTKTLVKGLLQNLLSYARLGSTPGFLSAGNGEQAFFATEAKMNSLLNAREWADFVAGVQQQCEKPGEEKLFMDVIGTRIFEKIDDAISWLPGLHKGNQTPRPTA
ncbi:hypothetical protein NMY22_g17367 [Coprinellus aureogranulatus]|nr:hypothetical protein NMY22_g17367 [Coprinellus aureogranulatus]